jgi:hypothetical protein
MWVSGTYTASSGQFKGRVESNVGFGVLDYYGFGAIFERSGQSTAVDEVCCASR